MSPNDNTPTKILIARTDRIGDLILTLPLASALKRLFPGVQITFLVRAYTAEIVKNCRNVDEVLIAPEMNGAIQTAILINQLKYAAFDMAFLVYPDKKVSWACFRAGIPLRIGTAYRWYSFLFNRKVHDHRKDVKYHELEYNLRMLHAINKATEVSPETVDYSFGITDEVTAQIAMPELQIPQDKKVVVIHPGSGGSAVDLPKEKFQELVANLSSTGKYTVIVTGNTNEYALCAEVCLGSSAINVAGKLNLLQLMVIIQKSNIFVSNSTGPLHIAAALNRYVIGFFPKIKTCSPERWAPYTAKRAVFVPGIKCSNCTREQCTRLQCMNSIDIQHVIQTIEEFSLRDD